MYGIKLLQVVLIDALVIKLRRDTHTKLLLLKISITSQSTNNISKKIENNSLRDCQTPLAMLWFIWKHFQPKRKVVPNGSMNVKWKKPYFFYGKIVEVLNNSLCLLLLYFFLLGSFNQQAFEETQTCISLLFFSAFSFFLVVS